MQKNKKQKQDDVPYRLPYMDEKMIVIYRPLYMQEKQDAVPYRLPYTKWKNFDERPYRQ